MKIEKETMFEKIPLPFSNKNDKKPPYVCSIPHLLDVDPSAPFEFSFPAQDFEPWWDDYDTYDSGFSDDDQDVIISSLPLSISISPTVSAIHAMEIPPETPAKTDDFVSKIISSLSENAPKLIYKRRKSAMKRRRRRRKRKQVSDIEAEFYSLWTHSNVGDLFASAKAGSPSADPPPSLPTINMNEINKNMLKRIDVIKLPVHGCSPDPKFYTEIVVTDSLDYYGRPYTLANSHRKSEPFGSLPAVLTDVGPVALPDEPFFGHTWSGDNWIVKAEYPQPLQQDPGGRHARGQGDGRRPDRGGQAGGRDRGQDRRRE